MFRFFQTTREKKQEQGREDKRQEVLAVTLLFKGLWYDNLIVINNQLNEKAFCGHPSSFELPFCLFVVPDGQVSL